MLSSCARVTMATDSLQTGGLSFFTVTAARIWAFQNGKLMDAAWHWSSSQVYWACIRGREMDRLKEPPCHLFQTASGPFPDRAKHFPFESPIL